MKRIESTQNAFVKHWKKLLTLRKEREKTGEFIVEGFHLVEEALKNKEQVIQVIVQEGVEIPNTWSLDNVMMVEVTAAIAREIAETEKTQGIFAHCKQIKISDKDISNWNQLLLLDAVQDPGNIGTIIRTCDAAGIDGVVLGKGCVDVFNPKTIRSSQGSIFHIPVVRGDLVELVNKLQERNIPVYGTALKNAIDYREVERTERFALIVGNEGSGIRGEILEKTNQNLLIPIYGKAESLNVAVATGILLYRLVD